MIEDGSTGVVGDKEVIAALNRGLKGADRDCVAFSPRPHAGELGLRQTRQGRVQGIDRGNAPRRPPDPGALLLGGLPNLQDLGKLYIGENLQEVIECDLRLGFEGVRDYRQAIKVAEEAHDYVSRDLFISILNDEEEHQEKFLDRPRADREIGIENFGQSQI